MIQKCPNCGQWCETDKINAVERFGKGWGDTVDGAAEVGSSIFGKKVGSFLGGAVGGILGYAGGYEGTYDGGYDFGSYDYDDEPNNNYDSDYEYSY